MKRLSFATFAALSCLLPTPGAAATAGKSLEKPNVLFIAIDDFRPELGCYGSPQVKTPHIDKLAAQGMRFDRAYCQVPICMGSRASLMTGILPTRTRFDGNIRADQDAPGAITLPEAFKSAGYTTISNGKIFHHPEDSDGKSWSEPAWQPAISHMQNHDPETTRSLSEKKRGRIFESPDVPDDAYFDGQVAQKTIKDMQRLKQSGKPFFLACGFIRPHMPFYAPRKYWDLYQRDEIEIAGNRSRPDAAPKELRGSGEYQSYHLADFEVNSDSWHRMMRHGYMASTSYADKLAGDVLAELDRLGLAENTIVVIWGDHGWHLGEHNFWGKHNTMRLATRVPLIIMVPGKVAGSTKALVECIDIFPTLCSLARLDVPQTVQGRSFVPLLDQPGQKFRDVAYNRFGNGDAVFTEGFSYTSYNGGQSEMLYDLRKDPEENQNVAGKPEYAATLKEMKALLKQRQDEAASAKVGGAKAVAPEPKPEGKPEATNGNEADEYEANVPKPTHSEVRYGPHERNVLDFWQAKADRPTPLVLVIHGGGWKGGSKERLSRFVDPQALLDSGISIASINYRLMKHAEGVVPPVKAPMDDAARALQFLRSKAGDWDFDPARVGAAGGSAGACTSLWLAYHDDLADPQATDPVARESTRLMCAALMGPQTTLDPMQMKEWTPNSSYGGHAFGKKDFTQFLAGRDSILKWIGEYSPYALASTDDPPVCLFFNQPPAMGKVQKDPTHSANFGIGLQKRCRELGIDCAVVYPGAPDAEFATPTEYLIAMLKGQKGAARQVEPGASKTVGKPNEQKEFDNAMAEPWKQVFADDCTGDWQDKWFLDGEVGTVKTAPDGMTLTAGPEFRNDAHHMVLWTKESFAGDLKIEYDFTRLDDENRCVTLLYIQATGSGEGEYHRDITKWNDLRKVPSMRTYYANMNLYHISYAAFGESGTASESYIRGRRYMPDPGKLEGTELEPDYFSESLFATGVKHQMTVIKKDREIFIRIQNPDETFYGHLTNKKFPIVTEGRIGLRHMFTRSARYQNFRMSAPASSSN